MNQDEEPTLEIGENVPEDHAETPLEDGDSDIDKELITRLRKKTAKKPVRRKAKKHEEPPEEKEEPVEIDTTKIDEEEILKEKKKQERLTKLRIQKRKKRLEQKVAKEMLEEKKKEERAKELAELTIEIPEDKPKRRRGRPTKKTATPKKPRPISPPNDKYRELTEQVQELKSLIVEQSQRSQPKKKPSMDEEVEILLRRLMGR